MSATGRGEKISPRDQYPTPAWCVRALTRWLSDMGLFAGGGVFPRHAIDPCAGEGAIYVARDKFLQRIPWVLIEIDPVLAAKIPDDTMKRHVLVADALTEDTLCTHGSYCGEKYDLLVTNPPYGGRRDLAMQFIETWMPRATISCWLLRLNWLGSLKRATWLRQNPASILVLPRRPSFHEKLVMNKRGKRVRVKHDATEYGWFVWMDARRSVRGTWDVADPAWCE